MASAGDIKKGMCLEINNDIFTVIDFGQSKSARSGAIMRTKMKSLTTGKVIEQTFNIAASISPVRIERKKYQYLYKDDTGYNFMDQISFEQITLEEPMVTGHEFLKEGQEVEIMFHADTERPLSCDLPSYVVLEITYSEPGVRGDTSNMPLKPATLETGARIMVPIFVNAGERVKVDTRTGEYSERVKD